MTLRLGYVAARAAVALAIVAGTSAPALAGTSPLGDTAAAWPASWNTYRMTDGTAVMDVLGDESPSNADLSSGPCLGSGCTGGLPTVYYASDGTTAFFRVRISVDPGDASKGGLTGNAYLTQLAVGGTVKAVVGVDGKSPSIDYVYTATAPGTTVTSVYEYPFTSPSAGMRVVAAAGGGWFLDYQVPISRITTASGGAITATTPIRLYYGSSAAANLATINKDFMLGAATAVSFANVATITLSPASVTTASSAVVASGPNPPVTGSATTYTVTLSVTNPTGGELTSTTVSATLPAGVTYVSGPASVSGGVLTWSPGTLLSGQTATADVVLSLTPPNAGTVGLLGALTATGEDAVTGTKTASAPALSVTATANAAPVATDDVLVVAEDGSATVDVLANDTDADSDALTATVSDPAHGTASIAGGVVTYTPAPDFSGTDAIAYSVCDSHNACDAGVVAVTVTPVADPPGTPADDAFSTAEDTAHSGTLPPGSDPDGDALTYAATTLPAHGTVTVGPDGSYTYTPDADWSGGDTFGYQVCDADDQCAAAVVTVTVTPVNDAPVAADAATTTPYEAPVTVTVDVTDVDGGSLTVSAGDPAHGSVSVDGKDVTYTPDAGFSGTDTVTYEVCDAADACDTATITVVVGPAPPDVDPPANTPPVAVVATPVAVASGTGGALDGSASTDADGDDLTYAWTQTSGPAATLTGADTATASFGGVTGPATLTFELTVSDGTDSDIAVVTVVVAAPVEPVDPGDPSDPPLPPVVHPPTVTPPSCDPSSVTTRTGITVGLGCDDADDATVTVVDGPAHGTVEVLGNGEVRYVPADGYAGTDAFTVRVCTPAGCTDKTVTVRVLGAGAVRPRGTLPVTGTPLDVLVAAAFLLVMGGVPMLRARTR